MKDGEYGSAIDETGEKWDGMVGEIMRGVSYLWCEAIFDSIRRPSNLMKPLIDAYANLSQQDA